MASHAQLSKSNAALRAAHHQLRHDHAIDISLASPAQLLNGDGRAESGVETLVGVLDSALRLPATLVVRISMPGEGRISEPQVDAFRGHCRTQANDVWREAMTLRQGGFRELPRALSFSVIAGVFGVVSGYFAEGTDSTLLMVLLYAVAFVAVIAAWTIGWAPIEQAMFDWRAPGHTAAVYELLSQARVEVVDLSGEPQADLGVASSSSMRSSQSSTSA